MRLQVNALNGSSFLHNSVQGAGSGIGIAIPNAQWDLNKASDGSRVGTCRVETPTQVLCFPTSITPGILNAGDSLVTSIPVSMLATTKSGAPAFQVTWNNPWGETQRGSNGDNDLYGLNDFHTIVTTGQP
ncbi:hypothetical protein ACIPJK_39485 [Streptomyces roseus]|uniref:hypothetical protein n=1 Tax=Streptomyces roseus TaxID=66430 RepID=UPI003819D642